MEGFAQLERDVNKCSVNELEEWATRLYEFIRSREDICTKHMVDFYIDDMWKKLPQDWQDELQQNPNTDLYNLIPRDAKVSPGNLQEFLLLAKALCLSKEFKAAPCSDDKYERLASFGMKIKKSYEVQHMAYVISSICKENRIRQVLDFGSGKGYLSEHLSVTAGLHVVGIDAVSSNTEGAQRRNYKIQKAFKFTKHQNQAKDYVNTAVAQEKEADSTSSVCEQQTCNSTDREVPMVSTEKNYMPITKFIDISDVGALLSEVEYLSGGLFTATEDSMLVGLHTCGDLCSSLLRLYCSSDKIKSMCCVGCCYHHITEPESPDQTAGFPLSSFLQRSHCKLGRNARMLGCQSLERQSTKFNVKQFEESIRSIFYRTILQVIICQKYKVSDLRKCNIGKVYQQDQSFVEYIRLGLRKLSLPDEQLSDTEIDSYLSEFEPYKRHLIAFHQLRALMAPCIESLIILDRLLYLKEQPSVDSAWVECLFDPIKSPRCLALVALKSFHK